MQKIALFGYGSLLHSTSLARTIPKIFDAQLCELFGYKRIFDFKSHNRFHPTSGIYSCALNLQKDEKDMVNGVYFTFEEQYLPTLMLREMGYMLVDVEVVPIKGAKPLKAKACIAYDHIPYAYVKDCEIQKEYLDICLSGAKEWGEEFYKKFGGSTYIDERTLDKHNDFLHLFT